MASTAAGCQYCASHNANRAYDMGVTGERIAAVWEFQTSNLFDDGEWAALSFAFKAGQAPSAVACEHSDEMREHLSEEEIIEVLFVIC